MAFINNINEFNIDSYIKRYNYYIFVFPYNSYNRLARIM